MNKKIGAVSSIIILLVYFTQLTTVRFGGLTEQAQELLDFQQMNLFFSFDLLGYALMALAGAVLGYANLQHILPGQDDAALREDARQMVRRALS